MIIRDVEPLPAAVVAERLGTGTAPSWLCSPGAGELAVQRQYVACDPVEIIRGDSPADLDRAWQRARQRWSTTRPETPVAIGYLSYDLGRPRPDKGARYLGEDKGARYLGEDEGARYPGLEFRFHDALWVGEGGGARILAASEAAADWLEERLRSAHDGGVPAASSYELGPLEAVDPEEQHLQAIARVKEYLAAGDAYQVNLARRLRARCRFQGPIGLGLFQRLASESPAPFALWLADHERRQALVGNSPERFLRVTTAADGERTIETAPIKGTRPRAPTAAGEAAIVAELAANPKDRAEHVMIVDLERNDLGRICETGSVEVLAPLRLLTLPSVHHLVTTVQGRLRPDVDLPAMLAACFPGGSITGAPKIRAMQIIDELEPAPRGPYTGASGWLGAAGDLDLAIAIRTAVVDGDELTLWVGGGIVIDSSAEAELEETLVKARAFSRLARPSTTTSHR